MGRDLDVRTPTLFIACAALGRDIRALIRRHGWNANVSIVNAKVHLRPDEIGPAVEERLRATEGRYARTVVLFGQCGAHDLDGILEQYGVVRIPGPHCFEMYGGEGFADAVAEQPGTFFLTDFLVSAWNALVERGLMGGQPELRSVFFDGYERVIYYMKQWNERLVRRAMEITEELGLPLTIEIVGFGDLERRLMAVMEGTPAVPSA